MGTHTHTLKHTHTHTHTKKRHEININVVNITHYHTSNGNPRFLLVESWEIYPYIVRVRPNTMQIRTIMTDLGHYCPVSILCVCVCVCVCSCVCVCVCVCVLIALFPILLYNIGD